MSLLWWVTLFIYNCVCHSSVLVIFFSSHQAGLKKQKLFFILLFLFSQNSWWFFHGELISSFSSGKCIVTQLYQWIMNIKHFISKQALQTIWPEADWSLMDTILTISIYYVSYGIRVLCSLTKESMKYINTQRRKIWKNQWHNTFM